MYSVDVPFLYKMILANTDLSSFFCLRSLFGCNRQSCLDHFTMEDSVFRAKSRFFRTDSRDTTASLPSFEFMV